MCIAVPYRVIDVPDPATAVVVRRGAVTSVSLLAADSAVEPGDWVLVHSGFVLTRMTDADARELEDLTTDGGTA